MNSDIFPFSLLSESESEAELNWIESTSESKSEVTFKLKGQTGTSELLVVSANFEPKLYSKGKLKLISAKVFIFGFVFSCSLFPKKRRYCNCVDSIPCLLLVQFCCCTDCVLFSCVFTQGSGDKFTQYVMTS